MGKSEAQHNNHAAAAPHVQHFLDRLRGVKGTPSGWVALCPAHDDRHPSLAVAVADDGRLLLCCHSHRCTVEAIVSALGLTLGDLFPSRDAPALHRNGNGKPRPSGKTFATAQDAVAYLEGLHGKPSVTWPYHNSQGEIVGLTLRWDVPGSGKRILPVARRADGWCIAAMASPRPLYCLPEMATTQRVIVTEGEKAADAARSIGLAATTAAGGAMAARQTDWSSLSGKECWLLPDSDKPGRKYAADVAEILARLTPAATVRVIELPGLPPGGDIVDWLAGRGAAAEPGQLRAEIEALARATPPWPGHDHRVHNGEPEIDGREFGTVLSTVTPEQVCWLWKDRIPLGKLCVMDGDPGLGKSSLSLDLAARVTRGQTMPDGTAGVEAAGVILLSAEDSLADTICPRLNAAGADVTRVLSFDRIPDGKSARPPVLPQDLTCLRDAIRSMSAKLVIIDPFMAFLDGGVNAHVDQDVRRLLHQLGILAEETGAAMVVIRHLNKAGAGNPLYRGGGSIGIVGAARSGLLVGRDPDNPDRRVLAPTKSNLAKLPPSLSFELSAAPSGAIRVGWLGASVHTAESLLAAPQDGEDRDAVQEGVEVLRAILAGGVRPANDVKKEARQAGVAEATLRRAKTVLGVRAMKTGYGGEWRWGLPEHVVDGAP